MNKIYSVGSVKKIRGHDGQGYSCNLLKNGKKVAEVLEDGWGGGLQIRWADHTTSAKVKNRSYDDKGFTFAGTVEEALFYAEVMKLPKIPASDALPEMNTSVDIVIDEMVNELLDMKTVQADLKKKFTIQCTDGNLLTWKITPVCTVEKLKEYAEKNYPGNKVMNDLPVADVINVYKKSGIFR